MRILFVSTTSATAKAFLLPIAQYERERGHDVSFACSPESFADAPCKVKELREAGFAVHEIPFAREIEPLQDARAFWCLIRLIQANRYDLVHTYTSKAGFIGRLAAKVAGCPNVIHTVLGFSFQEYNSGLKRRFFIGLEQIAALFCDRLLFISDFNRQEAIRYRLKNETELVFVGLSFDSIAKFKSFQKDATAVRSQYGIEQTDLLVGTVGRLVYQKGMDTFIRAAALVLKRHPDVQFIIAGDGPLRPELKELAHSLGITEKVQFVGFLEVENVMRLMSSLDVFVLSTRFEGLGLVYLEAMALQCPVVGSRIAPVTEVVKDGETGFLATVDDPEEFAKAILVLLEDSSLRRRMGAAGAAHVEREFNVQQVLERIDAVYQRIVDTSGSSGDDDAKKAQKLCKWIADRLVSAIALIVFSPVILIIAIAIYIRMGSPIVFSQKRPGKDGRIFTCYKFRTMTNDLDPNGKLLPDAERLTALGKFLRKTSLDELLQLWSVVKGDMSFVGPRPLLVEYLPYYSEQECKRHSVLPGITGLAQINGRNKLLWEERFQLDIEYVENQSLALDLYILFKTFWKVIARSDVDMATELEDFDKYRQKQMQLPID